jgi:flagellar export protein FliJ
MAEARARMAEQLVERAPRGGRLDLEALQWSEAYRRRLAEVYEASARDLVVREKERREAQGVYLERSRERKVLDKLRERRQLAWKREERTRDARILDDVSQAARAARSGGE